MGQDLTTLSLVKSWLGLTTTVSDELLGKLIRGASRFLLKQMDRSTLAARLVTEVYDGNNVGYILLRQFPVRSVAAIGFGSTSITTASTGFPRQSGTYYLDPPGDESANQKVTVFGYGLPAERGAVQVAYVAGFWNDDEPQEVPTVAPYQLNPEGFDDLWGSDLGVKFADTGVALVRVPSAPAAGQYAVDGIGTYTFAAANAGRDVLVSYGIVPADIVRAATEMVGERFKAKDRIGISGQGLAGKENITYFSKRDMGAYIETSLQRYMSVVPV